MGISEITLETFEIYYPLFLHFALQILNFVLSKLLESYTNFEANFLYLQIYKWKWERRVFLEPNSEIRNILNSLQLLPPQDSVKGPFFVVFPSGCPNKFMAERILHLLPMENKFSIYCFHPWVHLCLIERKILAANKDRAVW